MVMDIMNISNETIGEMVKNNPSMMMYLELTGELKQIKDEFKKFKAEQEILKTKQEIHENEMNKLNEAHEELKEENAQIKEVTFVLATDDGKRKTLTKLVNSLCYKKYTGKQKSLKDKLFHRSITQGCYSRLYDQFEVNSYTRIRIDDFEEAIKVVKRWYGNEQNIKRVVAKRLKEYQNEDELKPEIKNMVDKFLEITNGGNDL